MVRGIGVDMVEIAEMRRIVSAIGEGPASHMFTAAELAEADARADAAEYLATRFAVKEAVFKALAPLLGEEMFDLRIVETRNARSGAPYVAAEGELRAVLDAAGVARLHVSITTEAGLATAFVVAE